MTRATATKQPRAYRLSGFHKRLRTISKAGLSALDGRSAEARALKVWKGQIVTDLGGELSSQQLTLVEMAAQDMALLAVADGWLQENASGVINKRRRAFVPLVAERLRVASHLMDVLKALGLERKARPVESLAEILRRPITTNPQTTVTP